MVKQRFKIIDGVKVYLPVIEGKGLRVEIPSGRPGFWLDYWKKKNQKEIDKITKKPKENAKTK